MVRHIVTWNFKEGLTEEEKRENARQIKERLEALPGVIDGVAELKVYTDLLPASSRDLMLNSLMASEEALAAYQVHPEHKKVSAFVGSVTRERVCLDYYEA